MEDNKRYQVKAFSPENLVALFCAGAPDADPECIASKPQLIYLVGHCHRIGVRTLVFESDYVDRHFSEDYSGYYVRCYSVYRKKCSRIHYFTRDFDAALFATQILETSSSDINAGYAGFTVVKPLPETVIGRTCIAPFRDNRQYITGMYSPNLFGHDLQIESLPFQEQDHEVAACATSALWTALHGTAFLFDHPILTPLQITKKALESSPFARRPLPNDGLDVCEMAAVVRDLGMEAEVIEVDARQEPATARFRLQGALGAYLPLGIPPVLGLDLYFEADKYEDEEKRKPNLHAVTISGIKTSSSPTPAQDGFLLRATRIDQIYVHDDGVGPYAPISFMDSTEAVETSWTENGNAVSAYATDLLIPLYQQIRVPFSDIIDVVMQFNALVELVRDYQGKHLFEKIEWDVFLASSTQFKKEIVQNTALDADQKAACLTKGLPHYVWRAVAYVGKLKAFELVCDATDLLQGRWFIRSVCYDDKVYRSLSHRLNSIALKRVAVFGTTWQIFEEIKKASG